MPRKKTWSEKLQNCGDLPKVVELTAAQAERWGGRTLAIPSPVMIDGLMQQVPHGQLSTMVELRAAVAKLLKAEAGCPLTTGIFVNIAAQATVEVEPDVERQTPYWRTLKSGGELNPKFPGGMLAQKKLLQAEGHRIIAKGTKLFVADYAEHLKTTFTKPKKATKRRVTA
jgi:alkylated DNA nucleotide flippase Atl1